MSFPTPAVLPYSMQSFLGTTEGTRLDANFVELRDTLNAVLTQLELIQRDDGDVRNSTVHSDAFTSDALALMAGSSVASDLDWRPRGEWAAATLYEIGNIVQEGSPAVAYVAVEQHVSSADFDADYADDKWVVLSSPRELVSADIIAALSYTPVNVNGDTMLGALALTTGSSLAGVTISDTYMGSNDFLYANKGLFITFNAALANAYGVAANVSRTSGNDLTIASQFAAFGATASSLYGGLVSAHGLQNQTGTLIGVAVDMNSFYPESEAAKTGIQVRFKSRETGLANPGQYVYVAPFPVSSNAGQGLGSNFYNRNAVAVLIDSQERTATGEYCGWTRGIKFSEYALDIEEDSDYPSNKAYPIGIDFSEIHYNGGTDPTTAYNMDAAVALRDLQAIWWNRDPDDPANTNKVRTYFHPATGRWSLFNGVQERFGVDVSSGDLYVNGVEFSVPSLTSNNTWTGLNTFENTVYVEAGFVFNGLERRITGDFSNATIPYRTMFQTASLNSSTELGVIPNGTAGVAAFYMMGSSTAQNTSFCRLSVDAGQFLLEASRVGTGAYIPMTFAVNGSERMRIDHTFGQFIIGATAVTNIAAKMRVNGIIQCDNAVDFSVHRNGVAQTVADNTPTVLAFTTEAWDTNSSFNTGTSRFTPPAGTYCLIGACEGAAAIGRVAVEVYKNGVAHKQGNIAETSTANATSSHISCVVQANGTDYFELVVTQISGAPMNMSGAATDTYFQGYRIG